MMKAAVTFSGCPTLSLSVGPELQALVSVCEGRAVLLALRVDSRPSVYLLRPHPSSLPEDPVLTHLGLSGRAARTGTNERA